ncbi:regulatory particle non-ATPase [Rhizina undulata]
MADKELQTLYAQLVNSITSRDLTTASSHLTSLKLALLSRNALIPSPSTPAPTLLLARDILELGALTSIHLTDDAAFSRYYSQLQPFYEDPALSQAPSTNKSKIIGLHLLLLLSKNDIADFHTLLENLEGAEEDPFIKYPIMLERWLMEGSYDKVWNATKSEQVPSEEYALFSQVLVGTIRNEIATCSEKAYSSLPISNAKNLLFLDSDKAVIDFAQARQWDIRDGRIYFPIEEAEKEVLASGQIIENTIGYAHELEIIV